MSKTTYETQWEYEDCDEFQQCRELIERYYKKGQYEECFQGHLKLAQQGYALAQCQVGYFYLEGIGVSKNPMEGFAWTMKSAIQGDRDAQFNLADCYEHGIGTSIDLAEAKKWYTKSAQQGCKEAETRLLETGK